MARPIRDLTKTGSGLLRHLARQPLGVLDQDEMRNLFVADNVEFHLPAQPLGWTPWWFQHTGLANGGVGASRRSLFVARSQHRGTRINPLNLPVDARIEKVDISMKWAFIASKKLPFMTWREDFVNKRWVQGGVRAQSMWTFPDLNARMNRAQALKGIVRHVGKASRPVTMMKTFLKDGVVPGVTGSHVPHRKRNTRVYGIVNKTL